MSKLSLFLLIATLAYCTASWPFDSEESSESDSDEDFWDFKMPKMPKMPKMHFKPIVMPPFPKMPEIKPINPEDIKNMKPDGPNSYVQGSIVSQASSVKYVNGKKVVDFHKADAVLNDNGNVHEYHSSK